MLYSDHRPYKEPKSCQSRSDHSHSYSCEKKLHRKRIIGDLANQEKVLKFLDIRINNLMGDVNEKGAIEKTSITEPKSTYLKKQEAEI